MIASAMTQFWDHGFEATSIDDLVATTGASRHALYGEFDGKRDLFLAALSIYRRDIVTPAFAPVEAPDGDLAAVAAYFEAQITKAEKIGLPGPGCLIANAMTQTAPHDAMVRAAVNEHNARLRNGFRHALKNERKKHTPKSLPNIAALSTNMAVYAQGLWSMSRTVDDAAILRASYRDFLSTIRSRIIS